MAHTVERVGLVASLLVSGGLLAETIRAKVVDEPNWATKSDVAELLQQASKTSEGMDLVVAKQAEIVAKHVETDQVISQLQEDIDLVTYRDCVLENVMRSVLRNLPVSLKTCREEGREWMDQKALDTDDAFETQ